MLHGAGQKDFAHGSPKGFWSGSTLGALATLSLAPAGALKGRDP